MKILIITTKWAAGTLEGVYCATHRSLVRPAEDLFRDNPNVELEIQYIEKSNIWSAKQLNDRLLRDDFDICIYSPYRQVVPTLDVAKKLGKKLFICVWDQLNNATSNRTINLRLFLKNSYDNGVVKFEHSMYEYSDYCNILVGGNGYGQIFPNINAIFEPMDTSVLYPIPEEEKKYELAFIGSLYERERQWYVKEILNRKMPISLLGGKGDTEQKLSYEDWAKANREAKISLNFNGNFCLGGLKGRTWEVAACNNLMITTLPEVYKWPNGSWFTEHIHYVSIDQNNYVDKINYYMEHPEERIKIAQAMYDHWKANYTAEIWWNNIFDWAKD